MALTVEDGTVVTNANSYNTLVEIKAYAASRGFALPSTDSAIEIESNKAMDYLESKRDMYEGEKVSSLQELQFPRTDLVIDGIDFPADEIPGILKKAQCQLICLSSSGVDLMPTITGGFIKKEKIGPIETEYSENFSLSPDMPTVDALLQPLYKSAGGFSLSTLRV